MKARLRGLPWDRISGLLGLIGGGVLGVSPQSPPGWILLLGSAGSLVTGHLTRSKTRHSDIADLAGVRQELRQALDFDELLRSVAQGLDVRGGWRISVYQMVKGDTWYRVGRASHDESFETGGRESFSHKEGVLRLALVNCSTLRGGADESPPLPDRSTDPDGWASVQMGWGIGPEVVQKMRMSTRKYVGVVMRAHDPRVATKTLGVVLESLDPTALNIQEVEGILTRPFFEAIAQLLTVKSSVERGSAIVERIGAHELDE